MTEAWLKNPLSLFDIKDKVAIITGASGAFGALAAQVLSGAGCKLLLTAGKKAELDTITSQCAGAVAFNLRPTTEENCNAIVANAVEAFGRCSAPCLEKGFADQVRRVSRSGAATIHLDRGPT